MKAHSTSLKTIALLLAAALIAAGCQPALAEEVAVLPDEPFVSMGGPSSSEIAGAMGSSSFEVAMNRSAPRGDGVGVVSDTAPGLPLSLSAGTGQTTQVGVDLASINAKAETEGWPWYAKAGVVIGCVALVGLTTWAIVEASHSGTHDHDSSTHYTITADDGATMNVRIGSDNETRTGW